MKLGWIDLAVIAVYLIGITAFGARFRSRQHSLKDYFLGGRTIPWWAIALSIVSAETSILTIIGTPALAYAGNLGFLQVVFGYLLARVVISTVLAAALLSRRVVYRLPIDRAAFWPALKAPHRRHVPGDPQPGGRRAGVRHLAC